MTGNSTTLQFKSEFLKRSWNPRSHLFLLSCRFTLLKKDKCLYGEAPPQGLIPYPLYTILTKKVPLSHTLFKTLHPF